MFTTDLNEGEDCKAHHHVYTARHGYVGRGTLLLPGSSHIMAGRWFHYENMPMQYIDNFSYVKIENFQLKTFEIFNILAQNIDCGYMLERPR